MIQDIIRDAKVIGKNLKLLRIINEKTIGEVAKAAKLSNAHISMIERSRRVPRNDDLRKILKCYGYTLGYFLSEIQDTLESYNINPNAIVIPEEKHILLDGKRGKDSYCLFLLRPLRKVDDIELLSLYLPANTQMSKDYQILDCEIRGTVVKGKLLITFKDDEFVCNEGEELCFDGNKPHIFRNYTDQPVRSIIMLNPAAY